MFAVLSFLLLFPLSFVRAIGQKNVISFQAFSNVSKIASRESPARIIVDAEEWPAALRAARNLAQDFGHVTGTDGITYLSGKSNGTNLRGAMTLDISNWPRWNGSKLGEDGVVIIAGTLGRSSIIDALIEEGKINAGFIQGQWEAFSTTLVHNPIMGTSQALVVAGKSKQCLKYLRLTQ
jgi:hypothetical protein